jgi:hypothetical protein
MMIFVSGDYTSRGWCLFELAVGTKQDCRLQVVGSYRHVALSRNYTNFFESMSTTFQADKDLIQNEIRKEYGGNPHAFNHQVALALAKLILTALGNTSCALPGLPLEASLLPSKRPALQPRDAPSDHAVILGRAAELPRAPPPERLVRIYLCSSVSDTVLERAAMVQCAMPFLRQCARNRGLDVGLSDVRRDLTAGEEGAAPRTCLQELDRCIATSAGVCCLALLASKLGRRPLPEAVPADEMEQLLRHMDQRERSEVHCSYTLDTNGWDKERAAPAPAYVCTRPGGPSHAARRALRAAAEALWGREEERPPLDRWWRARGGGEGLPARGVEGARMRVASGRVRGKAA